MRFFKRREQEPQGQPKEASELPVYQEEDLTYFFPQSVHESSQILHDAQRYLYTSRGISAFEIKEWEVVEALAEAGYTCDLVIDGKKHGTEDWYYTDVTLEHGVLTSFSGIEIVRRGMAIATPAQHQRDFAESGRQWRRKRRGY